MARWKSGLGIAGEVCENRTRDIMLSIICTISLCNSEEMNLNRLIYQGMGLESDWPMNLAMQPRRGRSS